MTDTTFSPSSMENRVTPCVFLEAILISFTGDLIILPLFVTIMTSSVSKTGNDAMTLPLRSEVSILIIP